MPMSLQTVALQRRHKGTMTGVRPRAGRGCRNPMAVEDLSMAQTGDQVDYCFLQLRESLVGVGEGLLRIPPSITKVTLSLGSLAGTAGGSAHATKLFHAASLTSHRSAGSGPDGWL